MVTAELTTFVEDVLRLHHRLEICVEVKPLSWTLAIETGGTFTDLFVMGPNGEVHVGKVPSTPHQPALAARAALDEALRLANVEANAISRLLHGSTVAVNALIERSGTPPALIATQGFRDMLFIGRQEKTHIYDMFYEKPPPFVERANVFEIAERVSADGAIIATINQSAVETLVDRIVLETDAETIAVCLLHAYANPAHEQLIQRIITERHPSVHVVLSSDVCPVHREFERASTTVINAWLHPVVDAYLAEFGDIMKKAGCRAEPLIMQANGGVLPINATRQRPAGLYLSGPSAAVAGAAALARATDINSLITLDVGGTSTDICLVTHGEVHESGHGGACGNVQGQPLNQVMTDIVTIGAGGGSLAWVDAGGMLKVGPKSAGADPGPACYGRGGDGFTLSDAFLCLGLLADEEELPGHIKLSLSAALDAGAPLAHRLGITVLELAQSVFRIAVANMAEAIRSVTVRRGLDPRDYALFACGGAGPLVAAALAQELEVDSVLVPPDPGVFSAYGLTAAGIRMDFARAAEPGSEATNDAAALTRVLSALKEEAHEQFTTLGLDASQLQLDYSADARYVGQGFELRVSLSPDASPLEVKAAFHRAHSQRYGHAFEDQPVELTALRAVASSATFKRSPNWKSARGRGSSGQCELRVGTKVLSAMLVERNDITSSLSGPALVTEATSATYLPEHWKAEQRESGVLSLRKENGA